MSHHVSLLEREFPAKGISGFLGKQLNKKKFEIKRNTNCTINEVTDFIPNQMFYVKHFVPRGIPFTGQSRFSHVV